MHTSIPWSSGQLVEGPAVWHGPRLAENPGEWQIVLNKEARAAVLAALEIARERGFDAEKLPDDATSFPLPSLISLFADIRNRLGAGPGFVVLKGLPTDQLDPAALMLLVRGIGAQIGLCVSQNHRGERVGLVTDQSDVIADPRRYQAGGEFRMHVDPIDVVGLLCARKARRGGESYIVSSPAVHNVILSERPDLLAALYQGYRLFRPKLDRGEAPPLTANKVPLFAPASDGSFAALCLPDPVHQACLREGLRLSALEEEALGFLDRVSHREDLLLEMDLEPGDLQLLNNRVTLHGRRDYLDYTDPARRRLMLRLWLMMPDWPATDPRQKFFDDFDKAGGGIPKRLTA